MYKNLSWKLYLDTINVFKEKLLLEVIGIIGDPLKLGKLEKRVKDMVVGERGFIEYKALSFVLERVPYLDIEAELYKKPLGKKSLPIKRVGTKKNDYDVDIRSVEHRWEQSHFPFDQVDWERDPSIVKLRYNDHTLPQKRKPSRKSLSLQQQLQRAVEKENYEAAAKLRDQIQAQSQKRQ